MMDKPPLRGQPFLLRVYYHKIELLSLLFTILLVVVFYILAQEVVETRRQAGVIAAQGVQQRKVMEDEIRFNRFLIDRETARTGSGGRQGLIDQANLDRAELRRLEAALRAAGVRLPPPNVLEGHPAISPQHAPP
jgi:hypothetical protein